MVKCLHSLVKIIAIFDILTCNEEISLQYLDDKTCKISYSKRNAVFFGREVEF